MLISRALAHGGVGIENEGAGGKALLVILAVALASYFVSVGWKKLRKRLLKSDDSDKIQDQ